MIHDSPQTPLVYEGQQKVSILLGRQLDEIRRLTGRSIYNYDVSAISEPSFTPTYQMVTLLTDSGGLVVVIVYV